MIHFILKITILNLNLYLILILTLSLCMLGLLKLLNALEEKDKPQPHLLDSCLGTDANDWTRRLSDARPEICDAGTQRKALRKEVHHR